MRMTILAGLAMPFMTVAAVADQPVSAEEGENIQIAIAAWGCEGGEMRKESDGTFEVDGAACTTGSDDIELNRTFTVTEIDLS